MSFDARPRFPAVRPELPPIAAWSAILDEAYQANWFTNFGALSRRLENEIAARWGRPQTTCVVTSSGTAALAAPLIAQGIRGKVILPAFTFAASAWAIRMAGATPVLVDVDAEDWCISADVLDHSLEVSAAEAAILVMPFGLQTDLSAHMDTARRRNVCLVIDNAAGLGAINSDKLGANVFEVFSLHATKPFGVGEGGAILAAPSHEDALRAALNFGLPALGKPHGPPWGLNGKMSEVHAAIGLAVAADFERRLKLRRQMAQSYIDKLSEFSELRFPKNSVSAPWQLFPLLLPNGRNTELLGAFALEAGIETRRYYRPSLSRLESLERVSQCRVSEDLSDRMICVPIYSAEPDEREQVTDLIASALKLALA